MKQYVMALSVAESLFVGFCGSLNLLPTGEANAWYLQRMIGGLAVSSGHSSATCQNFATYQAPQQATKFSPETPLGMIAHCKATFAQDIVHWHETCQESLTRCPLDITSVGQPQCD